MHRIERIGYAGLLLGCLLLNGCGSSTVPESGTPTEPAEQPAQISQDLRFTASDGISLAVKLGGRGDFSPRPLIVEFSPYAPGCCEEYGGAGYNYLQVHIRGTGNSDGQFDALGPRTQQDVAEVLQWACAQSWSNGSIGLYGFSASAIMVYNSLHQPLSCLKTAVLGTGTHELFRDLLVPGGIQNVVPGTVVLVGIGTLAATQTFSRLFRDPLQSIVAPLVGTLDTVLSYLAHPTLDSFWQERGNRGDANHVPIMMITSFYDVEPRGPFQAFQQLRGSGAHLLAIGGHDGAPAGTEGLRQEQGKRWYDRYLAGIDNGVDRDPKVQLFLSDGDRIDALNGGFLRYDANDWPVPGTRWQALALDAARSGTSRSLNDGSLSSGTPTTAATQSYLELPSLPTATDPYTTAVIGGAGLNTLLTAIPQLDDMTLAELLGLAYTSEPLPDDLLAVGPASLELRLASTVRQTDIYAVISDVWPDGSAHPVATGRLRSSFPFIDPDKSLKDADGNVVQPYGLYSEKDFAPIGTARLYHVEFWPIGNRFQKGHRLRLHVLGVSAFSLPVSLGINRVEVGGDSGSRLLLPVVSNDGLLF